ncbi:tRNA preQ1(34) S-adenosylmethionine ribosyltransferase-isomerase QueA [Deinococcus roseus]|uniref:S-adenosylmethionine:tRNA ribosyltransferase-isomerase n=1 Tax=Deinococcus roseus TaxID=392414 RepID=A0ABQ2CY10_9DEIO|nr:tRNA preQ1(34) S-adenosylmethionine ribosyltransferase-isomerase QueA [Deinococcus roseus]GGJ32078.1 S-adenosylmethionine:tRNA ribosyltransferase-isomerase [Deinococcus roseus]
MNLLDFELPDHLIAQTGTEPRDHSRLMVVSPEGPEHRIFKDLLEYLQPGDVMVFNESRVIPARLYARKASGGTIEVLLLREKEHKVWSAYLKPARKANSTLYFGDGTLTAEVTGTLEDGARLLTFNEDIKPHLHALGTLPLPPYIQNTVAGERYQTVYSRTEGSVAAPTAGLHFTPELLSRIDAMGVERHHLTLHVGAGTFKPISGSIHEHVMHEEQFVIFEETAAAINRARKEGRRVIAVGTTTVRALESAVQNGEVQAGAGETRIFIHPPYTFQVPDLLITNFHLPHSTLLLLVGAFAGEKQIAEAYQTAIAESYRFYSLGDAMLLYGNSDSGSAL